MLAAGDLSQSRARDAPPVLVVIARSVAEGARDHAHEAPGRGDEGRIAVALAHDALAGGFAVHVDGDEERSTLGLRDREGVVEAALPEDLAVAAWRARRGTLRTRGTNPSGGG